MLLVGLVVLGFGFSYSDLLLRLYGGGAHLAIDGGTGDVACPKLLIDLTGNLTGISCVKF